MYNKLFTKILDSSIWLESPATKVVWFTFLAAMNQDGMAYFASVVNLANRAGVSVDEATLAVKIFESPDVYSSDRDNEGRRIERVPGGWIVLNAPKYRAIVTANECRRLGAERARRYRERKKKNVTSVTRRDESVKRNAPVTQSYADTNACSLEEEAGENVGAKKNYFPNGFDPQK